MEELKREIEVLSRYKMNVFHWHLTENQAWRLESKIFPMLNDSCNMSRMAPGKIFTRSRRQRSWFAFVKNITYYSSPEGRYAGT